MISSTFLGATLGLLASLSGLVAAHAIPNSEAPCVDPQGLQYAAYPNPATYNAPGSQYPSYAPVAIKTQQPEVNGVTGAIGLQGDGSDFAPYNNSNTIDGSAFIMDHRGYIKASLTGLYTIAISADDDAVDFWIGDLAYSGWNRSNSNEEHTLYESKALPSKTFKLVKNRYHPIRVIFGQAGGAYNMALSITDPEGVTLLGPSSSLSQYIVQYSCKPGVAPAFQPYGSET